MTALLAPAPAPTRVVIRPAPRREPPFDDELPSGHARPGPLDQRLPFDLPPAPPVVWRAGPARRQGLQRPRRVGTPAADRPGRDGGRPTPTASTRDHAEPVSGPGPRRRLRARGPPRHAALAAPRGGADGARLRAGRDGGRGLRDGRDRPARPRTGPAARGASRPVALHPAAAGLTDGPARGWPSGGHPRAGASYFRRLLRFAVPLLPRLPRLGLLRACCRWRWPSAGAGRLLGASSGPMGRPSRVPARCRSAACRRRCGPAPSP